jgi:Raf kinase inhibitor-like YbhB/YbcL family protein
MLASACGGGGGQTPAAQTVAQAAGFSFAGGDVSEGTPIATRFTCDGTDASPGLSWTGVPAGAKELALVVEDPDAPGGTFTHWLAYGLPPSLVSLPAAIPAGGNVAASPSFRQGANSFGRLGWSGPCPPAGETHGYVVRLLALNAATSLAAGADRGAFDRAVAGHVIAEARLVAPYERR